MKTTLHWERTRRCSLPTTIGQSAWPTLFGTRSTGGTIRIHDNLPRIQSRENTDGGFGQRGRHPYPPHRAQPRCRRAAGDHGEDRARRSALTSGEKWPEREAKLWCCQVKKHGPPIIVEPTNSGRKLTPLGEGSGTVEFEVFAAVEMTFQVEVIAD